MAHRHDACCSGSGDRTDREWSFLSALTEKQAHSILFSYSTYYVYAVFLSSFKKVLSGTFIKYALVGILGTLIDVGVLGFLVWYFDVPPTDDVRLYLFVTLSFLLAVINNFALNQWWTFRVETKGQKRRFVKFLLVSVGGLLLSNLLMFGLLELLDIFLAWDMLHLGNVLIVMLAKAITSLVVLLWNFFLNKYWTFRARILGRQLVVPTEESIMFSIVIPAYNEEKRLPETLEKILSFLEFFAYPSEILVADDGSTDQTRPYVLAMQKKHPGMITLLTAVRNKGKGHAIRRGLLRKENIYYLLMRIILLPLKS